MNMKAGVRGRLMAKLGIAAVLMIGLGYPSEVAADNTTRAIWGALSTVPFVYILYVLWVGLNQPARGETAHTRVPLRNTRLLILGTWGFYPIAYLIREAGVSGWSQGLRAALSASGSRTADPRPWRVAR